MFTLPVLWFAGAVVFTVLEALMSVGTLIYFGLGCLAGWVAALADLSGTAQTLIAMAASVLSLALFRGESGEAWMVASGMTGRTGTADTALSPGAEGSVSVGGSFWRAVSDEGIAAGEAVVVTGCSPSDATLLIVKKASTASN